MDLLLSTLLNHTTQGQNAAQRAENAPRKVVNKEESNNPSNQEDRNFKKLLESVEKQTQSSAPTKARTESRTEAAPVQSDSAIIAQSAESIKTALNDAGILPEELSNLTGAEFLEKLALLLQNFTNNPELFGQAQATQLTAIEDLLSGNFFQTLLAQVENILENVDYPEHIVPTATVIATDNTTDNTVTSTQTTAETTPIVQASAVNPTTDAAAEALGLEKATTVQNTTAQQATTHTGQQVAQAVVTNETAAQAITQNVDGVVDDALANTKNTQQNASLVAQNATQANQQNQNSNNTNALTQAQLAAQQNANNAVTETPTVTEFTSTSSNNGQNQTLLQASDAAQAAANATNADDATVKSLLQNNVPQHTLEKVQNNVSHQLFQNNPMLQLQEVSTQQANFVDNINTGKADAERPTATNQVMVQINKALKSGQHSISIKLSPAELGRVDVKMDWNNQGKTTIAIIVDKAETLDLLQRDSRMLERALQEAGLKTDNESLSFNLRQGRPDQQNNQEFAGSSSHAHRNEEGAAHNTKNANDVVSLYRGYIQTDSGVDISV